MASSPDRSYRFATAAHWRAGASSGLAFDGDALTAAVSLTASRIDGSEAKTLAGIDPCGRLRWLRRATGEVVSRYPFGIEVDGTLTGAEGALDLIVGARWLWARLADRLKRYDAAGLQWVGEALQPGLVAACGDGGDGVWTLGASGIVRHVDAWGRPAQKSIALGFDIERGDIAGHASGCWLAVIDAGDDTRWRLAIVNATRCSVEAVFEIAVAPGQFAPGMALLDPSGTLYVIDDRKEGALLGFARSGELVSRRDLGLAADEWPLTGLIWDSGVDGGVVLGGRGGIHRLVPSTDGSVATTQAVFVTPTLTSPEGTPGGWNRADIDVLLPRGTAMSVTIGTARQGQSTIDRAFQGAAVDRLVALDKLIGWNRARSYAGSGARASLSFLLDAISATHLWLRLEFSTPAGTEAPRLFGLTIRYPDRSWLDQLPAIYRDDVQAAQDLRRYLAPLEVLFDGLDSRIGGLASHIDPATAPDDWLGYLLGWLGFPATEGLGTKAQRNLLARAGELLAGRGTFAVLKTMLDAATGHPAQVDDGALASGFWVAGSAHPRLAARLGRDSRLVAQQPAAFILSAGTRLGSTPIGRGNCADIDAMLAATCPVVSIVVAVENPRQRTVVPILRRLLEAFVPAHCRVNLRVIDPAELPPGDRLDDNLALAGDDAVPLGGATRAGAWRLASNEPGFIHPDATAAPDGDRRLA